MAIKDIFIPLKYMGRSVVEGLDVGITIQSFMVDECQNVEIEEFEISLDYQISDKPHAFDEIALMINLMLSDGRHLQDKIFNAISPGYMEIIKAECLEEWRIFWTDVQDDHGLDEQSLI